MTEIPIPPPRVTVTDSSGKAQLEWYRYWERLSAGGGSSSSVLIMPTVGDAVASPRVPDYFITVGKNFDSDGKGSVYEPGGATTSDTLAQTTLTANLGGWAGWTLAQIISSTALTPGENDRRIRVTLSAATTESFAYEASYIGHASTAGNIYDSDPDRVLLLDSSGDATGVVSSGGTKTLEAEFRYEEGRNIVFEVYGDTSTADANRFGTAPGWTGCYLQVNELGKLEKTSGYTEDADTAYFVQKVELLPGAESFTASDGTVFEEAWGSATEGNFARTFKLSETAGEGRKALYGQFGTGKICHLEDYGLKGDYLLVDPLIDQGAVNSAATDNAPLWNAVMANASLGDEFYLPDGYLGFQSKPTPTPGRCLIAGRGGYTGLVKDYDSTGGSTDDTLFLELAPQYQHIENIIIYQGAGRVGGTALGHVATSTAGPAVFRPHLRTMTISGFNTGWWQGIRIDGTSGIPHFGARDIFIDDLFISVLGGQSVGLWLGGVNNAQVNGALIVSPATAAGLLINGSTINTSNLVEVNATLACSVKLDQATNVSIFCSALNTVLMTSSCVSDSIWTTVLGSTPALAGTNLAVYAGPTLYTT